MWFKVQESVEYVDLRLIILKASDTTKKVLIVRREDMSLTIINSLLAILPDPETIL